MPQKPTYLSKTLWINLAIAIAAFFPAAQAYIASNPEVAVIVISGVNIVLRIVSKDKLSIS